MVLLRYGSLLFGVMEKYLFSKLLGLRHCSGTLISVVIGVIVSPAPGHGPEPRIAVWAGCARTAGDLSDAQVGWSDHRHPAGCPDVDPHSVRPASLWSGGIVLLSAMAFASMLCEGAIADWSAVYLSGPLHATGVVPGLGYVVFSLAMVTVRLCGNRLLNRFRPDRLLPALALVATLGLAGALLIDQPPVALLGFGCLGIGLASVIPAVFSAAGRIPGLHPGTAVAIASACGWAGFVCGPPVIGRLSTWASLPVALGLLPLLTVFIVVGTLCAGSGPGCRGRR